MTQARPLRLLLLLGWLGGLGWLVLLLARVPTMERRETVKGPPPAAAGWYTGTFQPDAVFTSTDRAALPAGLPTAGSWLNGDAALASAATNWAPLATRRLRIFVAGYPQSGGCRLAVEFRDRDGHVTTVACPLGDPAEIWLPWDLGAPRGAESFRIVAEDQSSGHQGWLAFSAPLAKHPTIFGRIYAAAEMLAAVLLAIGIVGPVLLALRSRAAGPETRTPWWETPAAAGSFVLLALLALAWKKPWALHTPQLWAEDGSIFLMQAEADGLRSLFTPYMGYLHILPRLTALLASRLLDAAWWPAFYNGVAFAGAAALMWRIASPRLEAPGKAWMLLSFALVTSGGETLINLTNLQWFTAFFLIVHLMLAPAASVAAKACDIALLAAAGLTGPFSIAFLPLFAWRWFRARTRDHLLAFAAVLACAAIQGWQVFQTGPHFPYQDEVFRLGPFIEVLGRRLVLWPMLGSRLAMVAAPAVCLGLGGGLVALLLVWAARPDPLRRMRFPAIGAFLLLVAVSMYRARPDTWGSDSLWFSDRYFFIPRILLAWLLIWELGAAARALARTATACCVLGVVTSLGEFQIKEPLDYLWSWRCEPLRQGVPAVVPILPETWMLEYRGRPGPP